MEERVGHIVRTREDRGDEGHCRRQFDGAERPFEIRQSRQFYSGATAFGDVHRLQLAACVNLRSEIGRRAQVIRVSCVQSPPPNGLQAHTKVDLGVGHRSTLELGPARPHNVRTTGRAVELPYRQDSPRLSVPKSGSSGKNLRDAVPWRYHARA